MFTQNVPSDFYWVTIEFIITIVHKNNIAITCRRCWNLYDTWRWSLVATYKIPNLGPKSGQTLYSKTAVRSDFIFQDRGRRQLWSDSRIRSGLLLTFQTDIDKSRRWFPATCYFLNKYRVSTTTRWLEWSSREKRPGSSGSWRRLASYLNNNITVRPSEDTVPVTDEGRRRPRVDDPNKHAWLYYYRRPLDKTRN